ISVAPGPQGSTVRVTAPTTGTGGASGAAATLDVAAAVLALEHGVVPPTPNVFEVCHDLDVVTGDARACGPRTALVLSRGQMGSNSALVIRKGSDSPA
ncbi:ketosynthase chain-length factor, partial [Streptomyces goshikiensis]